MTKITGSDRQLNFLVQLIMRVFVWQVGEWLWVSRIEFLKDKYAFVCRCRGCAEINLPDLVLSAFRCVKPNCFGVVLAKGTAFYTKFIIDHPPSSEPHMQVFNSPPVCVCVAVSDPIRSHRGVKDFSFEQEIMCNFLKLDKAKTWNTLVSHREKIIKTHL